jgi:hypothetical protein
MMATFSVCFRRQNMYCTVQYIMERSGDNSGAANAARCEEIGRSKCLLVQGIQAADCIKYFCLHSGRKDGVMNA